MYGIDGGDRAAQQEVRRACSARHAVFDPGFEARVEKVHAAYVEAIKKVYYTHRVDYGWGDRPLVIV